MKGNSKGFTLIEMLIVITVIAILISIALPRFKGMQDESNIAKAKSELRTIQSALESYYVHNNSSYPADLTTLETAVPNVINDVPGDPFAADPSTTTYGYVRGGVNNKLYVVFSRGLNGVNNCATFGATPATATGVTETDTSCIFVSNAGSDTTGP